MVSLLRGVFVGVGGGGGGGRNVIMLEGVYEALKSTLDLEPTCVN